VVVAVTVVPVVQPPVNEVVGVVAVRHGLVRAARVVAATIRGGAGRRVRLVHGNHMLVVVVAVNRVEMPVVQVVVVVAVRDTQVAARLAVDVGVVGVGVVTRHYTPPFVL
jgi:dihydrodipicolinate synthase/N-acetylneuraminate lyase